MAICSSSSSECVQSPARPGRDRGRPAPASSSVTISGDGQRAQRVDLGARQQRRDNLERGILGGGADQHDVSALDVGQKRVLLGLVETVDFVDEQHGAAAHAPIALGVGHHFLDFLDAAEHGAERDEVALGEPCDQAGERGLAYAGRSPRVIEPSSSSRSMSTRSGLPGPRMCSCPTNSSMVCGRMRSASGRCLPGPGGVVSNRLMAYGPLPLGLVEHDAGGHGGVQDSTPEGGDVQIGGARGVIADAVTLAADDDGAAWASPLCDRLALGRASAYTPGAFVR